MKRKLLCIIIAMLMVVMNTIPVMAEDEVTQITWGDSSTVGTDNSVSNIDSSKIYLALGADLTPQQLATVLSLMGLAGQDISQYSVVYVTNADEKAYLGGYLDPAVIGSKALSSVLVKPAEAGHGVQVTTQNINYCTVGMYRNALLTAGVKDADISVVGPTQISGTAALIGALKAYENMSGKDVTEQSIDTALDELITTGEIASSTGDSEEIAELIAFIKAEIAGKDLNTKEEIEAAVREAAKRYGTSLSDDEINQIVDLMVKIKKLGIDYDTLLDQAQDLYSKFGKDIDFNNLGSIPKDEIAKEITKKAIGSFFTGILEGITGFFKGLFGKK